MSLQSLSVELERIKVRAEELFANKEWRDSINTRAGRNLTCKEMFAAAEDQAASEIEPLTNDFAGSYFSFSQEVEPESRPVAETAVRLVGPTWIDAHGSHVARFHRVGRRMHDSDPFNDCWQLVDFCNGEVWQVVEMPDRLATVCDTPTGALWALRGILASWMRRDVRSTKGH